MSTKSNPKNNIYDKIMFQDQISLCKVINGRFNFMLKLMVETQRKYANFAFECPFPMANHTLTNFPIDDTLFPPLVSGLHFRVFMALSAQVPGIKSMKEIYNLLITGSFGQ